MRFPLRDALGIPNAAFGASSGLKLTGRVSALLQVALALDFVADKRRKIQQTRHPHHAILPRDPQLSMMCYYQQTDRLVQSFFGFDEFHFLVLAPAALPANFGGPIAEFCAGLFTRARPACRWQECIAEVVCIPTPPFCGRQRKAGRRLPSRCGARMPVPIASQ